MAGDRHLQQVPSCGILPVASRQSPVASRSGNFGKLWRAARAEVGRPDLHLHDLRHFANTLAAAAGASTKELMARLGHASPAAALRYQHATRQRDRAIAGRIDGLIDRATDQPRAVEN